MGGPINMIDPDGFTHSVDEENVPYALSQEWRPETKSEGLTATDQKRRTERFEGTGGTIAAAGLGILRSVTGGASDVAARALGVEADVRDIGEAHPTATLAGEVGGYFTPGVGGAIGKLGGRLAKGGAGIGVVGRAAAGGVVEGGLAGLQQGVSELALSEEPVDIERAASVLSSNFVLGGAIGGGAGALGKSAELGLARGKKALERATARGVQAEGIAADLATLDAKGLRGAKQAELDAIEAGRVGQRSQLADDIGAHRQAMRDEKLLLVTKDAKDAEIRSLAARSAKADKALRGLLDNPIALAEKPQQALSALQRQQSALEGILAKADDIKASFASDKTGERLAALEKVSGSLERNKALQQRLGDLAAAPTSTRLSQIADAQDLLATGGKPQSTAEKMLAGTLFGLGAGAVGSSGLPGSEYVAPLAGAAAAGMVGGRVLGRVGKAAGAVQERAALAVGKILNAAQKVTPAAPILATKILTNIRYDVDSDESPPLKRGAHLADAFKKRSGEVLGHVTTGPDGKHVTTMKARQKIAASLAPVAAYQPLLADKMETQIARGVEYLANAIPKRPDLAGMQMGPDRWRPSDMEMRSWARKAAAVADPAGVFERAAAGSVSPEDAEVLAEVYPEMLADFKRQVVEQLPSLRKNLPFNRRLALSILTGVAVDPALDPRILRVLQAQYVNEEGSESGMQAPRAEQNFGSVRSQDKATPAQSRAAGQEA